MFATNGRRSTNQVNAEEGEVDNGFSPLLPPVIPRRFFKLLWRSGRDAVGFAAKRLMPWGITTTPVQFNN